MDKARSPDPPAPLGLVRDAYDSCMDVDKINEEGRHGAVGVFKHLLATLDLYFHEESNRGKPGPLETRDWQPTEDHVWYKLLQKARKIGAAGKWSFLSSTSVFIKFSVIVDLDNPSKYIMSLDQQEPPLKMPRKYLLGTSTSRVQSVYKETMVEFFTKLLGAEEDLAKEIADELLEFEKELASIMKPEKERQEKKLLYRTRTQIKDLSVKTGIDIPWLDHLKKMLGEDNVPLNLNEDAEVVICNSEDYMMKLGRLLKDSVTPPRVQVSYIIWRLIAEMHGFLNEEALDIGFKITGPLSRLNQVR